MKMHWRVLCIALIFVSSCISASAAKDQSEKVEIDTRLDKKIVYNAENKTLVDVLANISKQTGVELTVSSDPQYWSVRQRRVTLYINDMSLRSFIQELQELLDYRFSRSGEAGSYKYILWQTLNQRKNEQAAIAAQKEEVARYNKKAIDDTVNAAKKALQMTDEEIEQAKKDDPYLAYLASDPRGMAYAQILTSIPSEAFDAALQNAFGPNIEIAKFSPDAASAIREAGSQATMNGSFCGYEISGVSINNISITSESDITIASPLYISLNAHPMDAEKGVLTNCNMGVDSLWLTPSDSNIYNMESFPGSAHSTELEARYKSYKAHMIPVEADPDLDKKIYVKNGEFLSELAVASGFNIMYECFPQNDCKQGASERTLRSWLEIACKDKLFWTKDGKTIRIRWQNWAQRRSWEIPQEWIDEWMKPIEKYNELGFDTIRDMASKLSDAQIRHNFEPFCDYQSSSITDPLIVELFNYAGADVSKYHRSLLEFYGRLTALQKEQIWSSEGLSITTVANDPMFADLGDLPEYLFDYRLRLTVQKSQSTGEDSIGKHESVSVWWKDIPEDERSSSPIDQNSLTDIDTKPVKIASPFVPIYEPNRKQVKATLEKIKKAREEKAKEDAEAQKVLASSGAFSDGRIH